MLRDVFDNRTYGWLAVPNVPDGTEPGGWAHVAAGHVSDARESHYSAMQGAKMVKAYKRERGRLMSTADKVYFKAGQRNFLGVYQPLVDAANEEQRRRAEEGRAAAEATRKAAAEKRAAFLKEQLAERSEALQAEVTAATEDALSPGGYDESDLLLTDGGDDSRGPGDALLDTTKSALLSKGAMPTAADIEAAAAADVDAAVAEVNPNDLLASLLGKAGDSAAKRAEKKRAAAKRGKGEAAAKQAGGSSSSKSGPTQRDQAVRAARMAATDEFKGRLQEEGSAKSEEVLSDVLAGRGNLPTLPGGAGVEVPDVVSSGLMEGPGGLEDAMDGFREPPGTDAFAGAGLSMDEVIEAAQASVEMVQEILAKLLDVCGVELF